MRRIFNKIICFTAAAVAAVGVFTVSACSSTFKTSALDGNYSKGEVAKEDNGGFAVKKGDYIYFINGKEVNTADNTYGGVVKGAVMRISETDFANRNYSNVQTVVPQIAYSGNCNAGIYVYGDYVYYSTPSTEKNSDGEVQNSFLAFKSTKLDGTEAMKDYYVQYSDNTVEYRYVEENGVVYLLYVASDEKLFGEETGVKNLHSYNTKEKSDTLLAYNVDSVTFDKNDLTNSRVYYTMKVTDFVLNKTYSTYNQVYTVTASAERKFATGAKDYTEYLTKAFENSEEGYDSSKDPEYVNCGTLVYDGIGIGSTDNLNITPFNGEGAENVNRSAFTYTISSYQNGNLFYTRTRSSLGSTSAALLFNEKETDILKAGWNSVSGNPEDDKCLIRDGSASSSYTYLFDKNGNIENVLIANSNGFIKTVINENGELVTKVDGEDTFYMTTNGQPTILFIDYSNKYIYYSVSKNANGYSVNGYSVNRVKYDGNSGDYYNPFGDIVDDYTPVCVLDLDAASDWYKPEMFDGQILFPTQTENMTDYVYILACDLRGADGKVLNNKSIKALNDKYKGVSDKIAEIDEKVYENLPKALKYAFYTDDADYIDELIQAYVSIMDYDEEHFWSKQSVEKYKDFIAVQGDWSEYSKDTVKVNGNDVSANKRDYYYSLLGQMNENDAKAYSDLLKTNYLQSYPEKEKTWFEGLSAGAKAGFIIGVTAGGLIIIAAAAIVTRIILRKRKDKLPSYKKQRIKVDTTDDKNIDVYSDEQ